MNREPAFRRVRARLTVLPAFETLAPDPVGALARLADLARVDARHLEREAARATRRTVRVYGPARAVTNASLDRLGPALASRVVRRLLADVRGTPVPVTAAHVAAALRLPPGRAVDLPGARVTCGGGWLAAAPPKLAEAVPIELALPGRTAWPPVGVSIVATVAGRDATGQLRLPLPARWEPRTVPAPEAVLPPGADPVLGQIVLGGEILGGLGVFDGDKPTGTLPRLVVRARRPGDRIATDAGTRSLQDLFVNAGVPRVLRDLVPLVSAGPRILWVPGLAVDATAAAAGSQAPLLHLAVSR